MKFIKITSTYDELKHLINTSKITYIYSIKNRTYITLSHVEKIIVCNDGYRIYNHKVIEVKESLEEINKLLKGL